MSLKDKFEEFITNKIIRVSDKKSICKLIIFGAYYPPGEKRFLRKIKKSLQEDGYEETWLVEEYPNSDNLSIRNKSIECLDFSDINLFIITFKGKQGGLTVELEYVIRNASRISFKTIVFFEVKAEEGKSIKSLSQLQIDGLIDGNIRFYPFEKNNFQDLFEAIRGKVWSMHYHYVINENRY